MKICIPIKNKKGIDSSVHDHFGSAPYFLIFDDQNSSMDFIDNSNMHHSHGMCQPMGQLSGKGIDVVVCNGMGARAVQRLNESGIKAYKLDNSFSKVKDIIAKNSLAQLQEITIENLCQDHSCH